MAINRAISRNTFDGHLARSLTQSFGVGVGKGNMQIVKSVNPLHYSAGQYRR